jgi:hypothetical protein
LKRRAPGYELRAWMSVCRSAAAYTLIQNTSVLLKKMDLLTNIILYAPEWEPRLQVCGYLKSIYVIEVTILPKLHARLEPSAFEGVRAN